MHRTPKRKEKERKTSIYVYILNYTGCRTIGGFRFPNLPFTVDAEKQENNGGPWPACTLYIILCIRYNIIKIAYSVMIVSQNDNTYRIPYIQE